MNRNYRRTVSLLTTAWLALTTAHAQTPPTIAQGPASQAVQPGTTVSFTVTTAGTGPFLYQWRFNGSNISGIITAVAGNGTNSFSGDGQAATNAGLSNPYGVAVSGSGNVFIADYGNSRIRKVATNGVITTFAGNGTTNFHGDGAQATSAGIHGPINVAVDASNNVFICDFGNNRVRKVATNGVITTVAGGGTNSPGNGGAATNATCAPAAVAVDAAGNLFIADAVLGRIRKVATNGIISTVAGGGTAALTNGAVATNVNLYSPQGVAVDRYGNLFIATDQSTSSGFLVEAQTNGTLVRLGPPGASGAYFAGAAGVGLNLAGNLFVASYANDIVLESGVITPPFAGQASFIPAAEAWLPRGGYGGNGGSANQALLYQPFAVAADSAGDVFIADTGNNRIRKVLALGQVFSIAAVTTNNAGLYDVIVSSPYGSVTSSVAVLSIGTAPSVTNLQENVSVDLGSNATLSATVTGNGPFTYQWQFDGTNLPVTITTVAGDGEDGEWGDGGQATNAELYAGGVGVDALGDFFIADSANDRVREVNAAGIITTVAATNASLFNPTAVAVDSFGNLYIADEANNRIREVSTNGVITTFAGDGIEGYSGDGGAATNAGLSSPSGVAVDGSGNVYIADQQNHRIRRVDANGVVTTIAGTGTNGFFGDGGAGVNANLSAPEKVAVDAFGDVFIADSGNKRIRKVSANGIITTVAGNGAAGYYGDGGWATNAFFEEPSAVAVDGFGNFYIADGTQRVRKVTPAGIISTVAGNAGLGFGGDGGPPAASMLGEVYGLATDIFGSLYIADTGNSRIRKINNFGPTLPLNNFSSGEAGSYDLVISNPFGSVTSAVITVTARLPPLAPLAASLSGGDSLVIQFSGAPGSNYVLQVASDLTPPVNWQPLATNMAGTNGVGIFTETNLLGRPALFYRLALP